MAKRLSFLLKNTLGIFLAFGLGTASLHAQDGSILNKLKNTSTLSSTVPSNGDVNPYGLVRVPNTIGNLHEGHYLVSNFNNSTNAQGTGTTIVDVSPGGGLTLFAQINPATLPGPCPGGVGLTTALAVLKTGWVIVGSLPTSDGTSATAQAGCLIVLNSYGNPVETIYGSLINGPWDMTSIDTDQGAVLFVTNVLNGTVAANGSVVNQGTVVRVNLAVSEKYMPSLLSLTVVGTGFPQRTDPNALVIGPTGLALSPLGQGEPALYVADTLNNRIAVIDHPFDRWFPVFAGKTLTSGGSLNGPLGLTAAPDGHLIVVNGGDGYATEITPQGNQIAKKLLDNTGTPPGNGALFGVLFDPEEGLIYVDDASNTLNKLQ